MKKQLVIINTRGGSGKSVFSSGVLFNLNIQEKKTREHDENRPSTNLTVTKEK